MNEVLLLSVQEFINYEGKYEHGHNTVSSRWCLVCEHLLACALGVNVEGQCPLLSGLNAWEKQNHLVVSPWCSA